MFHFLTRKIIPVATPIVGVLCIGNYLQQEVHYQTRNASLSGHAITKRDIDDDYKEIMLKFFFH